MRTITLNSRTEKKLASLEADLPHAVLLAGEPGVGLATIAKSIAGKELLSCIEPIDNKEQVNHDTGTISVSAIRELYKETRAKSVVRRIVVIDDADRMSTGAQAAFLKLLEEPSKNTHFILTSHSPRTILPTIRSRVQTVTVEPISSEQTKAFIDNLGVNDTRTRVQLEYLATGLPAELMRLTSDAAYFKQRAEIMADTRTFLTGTAYQKLLVIHAYYQSRAKTLQLLDSMLAVSKRSLSEKPQESLVIQLAQLLKAREKIEANCNARLQLMALVVQ